MKYTTTDRKESKIAPLAAAEMEKSKREYVMPIYDSDPEFTSHNFDRLKQDKQDHHFLFDGKPEVLFRDLKLFGGGVPCRKNGEDPNAPLEGNEAILTDFFLNLN